MTLLSKLRLKIIATMIPMLVMTFFIFSTYHGAMAAEKPAAGQNTPRVDSAFKRTLLAFELGRRFLGEVWNRTFRHHSDVKMSSSR